MINIQTKNKNMRLGILLLFAFMLFAVIMLTPIFSGCSVKTSGQAFYFNDSDTKTISRLVEGIKTDPAGYNVVIGDMENSDVVVAAAKFAALEGITDAKYASEIPDYYSMQYLVLIGTRNNYAIYRLTPEWNLADGEAIVRIIDIRASSTVPGTRVLVIAGNSAKEIALATNVLLNYQRFYSQLDKYAVKISGTTLDDVKIISTALCSDGTDYYSCSLTKPKYCQPDGKGGAVLIDKCSLCGCAEGVCSSTGSCIPVEPPKFCTDSDGENIFLASSAQDNAMIVKDICKNELVVSEAVCDATPKAITKDFACEFGCIDGHCKNLTCADLPDKCVPGKKCSFDSDCNTNFCNMTSGLCDVSECSKSQSFAMFQTYENNYDYYLKSVVNYGNIWSEDFCVDASRLIEFSCYPEKTFAGTGYSVVGPYGLYSVKNSTIVCENGCADGRCISKSFKEILVEKDIASGTSLFKYVYSETKPMSAFSLGPSINGVEYMANYAGFFSSNRVIAGTQSNVVEFATSVAAENVLFSASSDWCKGLVISSTDIVGGLSSATKLDKVFFCTDRNSISPAALNRYFYFWKSSNKLIILTATLPDDIIFPIEFAAAYTSKYPSDFAPPITDFSKFNYILPLKTGWNLVGIPFTLDDARPSEVFKEAVSAGEVGSSVGSGNVINVFSYDPSRKGRWNIWHSDSNVPNTLTSIDGGRSYWVYSANPSTLRIKGTFGVYSPGAPATVPFIPLKKGWNMISPYSTIPIKANEALASIAGKYFGIYAWNPSSNGFVLVSNETTMNVGTAYFINMKEDAVYIP